MSEDRKANPEVQVKAECRRSTAEYKRGIIAEAEQCQGVVSISSPFMVT